MICRRNPLALNLATVHLLLLLLLLADGTLAGGEDKLLDSMEPVKEEDAGDYLIAFGYVGPSQLNEQKAGMTGDLSNVFEGAVKAFQEFANIPVTGVLDTKTRKKMAEPRCGMQDQVEMLTTGGGPAFKWHKKDLTYKFESFTPDLPQQKIRDAIKNAWSVWATVTPLTFKEVSASAKADINIKFASGYHDDAWPFDKRGGVLAHATMPPSGLLHFDEAENWVYMDKDKIKQHIYTDLLPVAIHEGGHALGLSHSKAEKAIMAPFYQEQIDSNGNYIYPKLANDDIKAIQAIYGPKAGGPVATQGEGAASKKTVHHTEKASDGEADRGGEQPTLGQQLFSEGKKALKNMFLEWVHKHSGGGEERKTEVHEQRARPDTGGEEAEGDGGGEERKKAPSLGRKLLAKVKDAFTSWVSEDRRRRK